jgi:hypothetical protein
LWACRILELADKYLAQQLELAPGIALIVNVEIADVDECSNGERCTVTQVSQLNPTLTPQVQRCRLGSDRKALQAQRHRHEELER